MRDSLLPTWGSRSYVMGVINVTPDSFSGDGLLKDVARVREVALTMERVGVDFIDVGGESTRPGHMSVTAAEETARVVPAVRAIARNVNVLVSVDTSKAVVADRALDEGARIVNDVSGLRDPLMASCVASHYAGLVCLHSRQIADTIDLVEAVKRDLESQIELAVQAGVEPTNILIDPGLGMGKRWHENAEMRRKLIWRSNFEIMNRLTELRDLGMPILVGPSRKGMIGGVLGTGPEDRLEGSIALVSLCIANGADIVRVHDVSAMVRAVRVIDALAR